MRQGRSPRLSFIRRGPFRERRLTVLFVLQLLRRSLRHVGSADHAEGTYGINDLP